MKYIGSNIALRVTTSMCSSSDYLQQFENVIFTLNLYLYPYSHMYLYLQLTTYQTENNAASFHKQVGFQVRDECFHVHELQSGTIEMLQHWRDFSIHDLTSELNFIMPGVCSHGSIKIHDGFCLLSHLLISSFHFFLLTW